MMRLKKILLGLLLCGLLSTLIAACGVYDVSGKPSGPRVHMGAADFLQPSVTIHQGDMLTLVDDATSNHIIKNGSWVKGVAKPGKEPGAPLESARDGHYTTEAARWHLHRPLGGTISR
jgi:hypothetical protein